MNTPQTQAGTGNIPCRCLFLVLSCLFLLALPSHHDNNVPGCCHLTLLGYEQATPDSEVVPDEPSTPDRRAQLLDALGARSWHEAGFRGRGVKIAILDSGFCGYRAQLGKALPAQVTTCSFRADGNLEARDSQHGILCAEVVHTLAPEAELLLANWEPERPEQFLQAAAWAKQQGARVFSCSVIMPTWSDGEGHGRIHDSLTALLGNGGQAQDLLMFASAGNTAQRHWGGLFQNLGDGYHDWGGGVKDNLVTPWGGERVSVELCCQPGASYRLQIDDVTSGRSVGVQHRVEGKDRCCIALRFTPQAGHSYALKLRQLSSKAGSFHVVVLGGGLQISTRQGSIPFPGDGPEVCAVGAVKRDGHRLAYSSCGPCSSQLKPDFVASVPFPSQWRMRPFTGTSAAAPQAAAVAALVWCRHPDWTAKQVRESLKASVTHLSSQPHNFETGFGRIHLP